MVAVIGKGLGALGRVGGAGRNWQRYIYSPPESSLIIVDGSETEHTEMMKSSFKDRVRASCLCSPFTEVLGANLKQLCPDRMEKHFSCKENISKIYCT